jgi:hypothetical protein
MAAAVRDRDEHAAKNRMSGLWSETQPLAQYLRHSGHKTLIFTGVNTDQCVLGTLVNAHNIGWDCVLLEDCCATPTDGQAATVANVAVRLSFFQEGTFSVSLIRHPLFRSFLGGFGGASFFGLFFPPSLPSLLFVIVIAFYTRSLSTQPSPFPFCAWLGWPVSYYLVWRTGVLGCA